MTKVGEALEPVLEGYARGIGVLVESLRSSASDEWHVKNLTPSAARPAP